MACPGIIFVIFPVVCLCHFSAMVKSFFGYHLLPCLLLFFFLVSAFCLDVLLSPILVPVVRLLSAIQLFEASTLPELGAVSWPDEVYRRQYDASPPPPHPAPPPRSALPPLRKLHKCATDKPSAPNSGVLATRQVQAQQRTEEAPAQIRQTNDKNSKAHDKKHDKQIITNRHEMTRIR